MSGGRRPRGGGRVSGAPEGPRGDRALAAALCLVAGAARLVPPARRREWLRAWRGDLLALAAAMERGRHPAGRSDLVWRALGAWRDGWDVRMEGMTMEAMMRELRSAARSLGRTPLFTALTVGVLGLGIGLTTVMFSVVQGVLLRPLGYPEPDRVVRVLGMREGTTESGRGNVSYANVLDFDRRATENFEAIAAAAWWTPALVTAEGSEVLHGSTVTANFFDVLGITPAAGRFFRPGEQGEGRAPQVVISHGAWTRHFGRDPETIGRTAEINGTSYTIVGVLPADYEDPQLVWGTEADPEIFRTYWRDPSDRERSARSWQAVGRLKPDASLEAARAELGVLMTRLAEEYPEENADRGLTAEPLREHITAGARPMLWALFGIVGLVLLITCANVAGLFLGRALDRGHELAVRAALGASRPRLFAQLLTESTLLGLAGGALGLALVPTGIELVRGLAGVSLPLAGAIEVDGAVLAFALGASVLTGIAFGALPALSASGARGAMALRASRGATSDRRGRRLRRWLVAGEVALSVWILVGTGLLFRSLWKLQAVDLGIEVDGVVAADVHGVRMWDLEPEEARARWERMLAEVEAIPGVAAAGAIDYLPLSDHYSCDGYWRADRPRPEPGEGRCAEVRSVLPGTFAALGVPLLRGRLLDRRDVADASRATVVSVGFAEAVYPEGDPVGKILHVHGEEFEIVGVAGEVLHFGPGAEQRPQVYLPAPQEPWNGAARGLTLVARGPDGRPPSEEALRAAVARVDPLTPVTDVRRMQDVLASNLASPRFRATLFAGFAGLAALLAVLGLTGITANAVRTRRREIGVRMACGAGTRRVVRHVLGDGLRLTAVGLAVGLAGAWALARTLDAFLYEVDAHDPVVFAGVAALFAVVALAAQWWPARRAARVDPAVVLRQE